MFNFVQNETLATKKKHQDPKIQNPSGPHFGAVKDLAQEAVLGPVLGIANRNTETTVLCPGASLALRSLTIEYIEDVYHTCTHVALMPIQNPKNTIGKTSVPLLQKVRSILVDYN